MKNGLASRSWPAGMQVPTYNHRAFCWMARVLCSHKVSPRCGFFWPDVWQSLRVARYLVSRFREGLVLMCLSLSLQRVQRGSPSSMAKRLGCVVRRQSGFTDVDWIASLLFKSSATAKLGFDFVAVLSTNITRAGCRAECRSVASVKFLNWLLIRAQFCHQIRLKS